MTLQTTPEVTNATASYGNAMGLTGVIPIMLIIAISAGAVVAARPLVPWLAKTQLLGTLGDKFTTSLAYALRGLVTVITVGLVIAPIYAISQADGTTQSLAATVAVAVVAGYIALVGIGYGSTRLVDTYVDAHPTADSLDDLLPDTDDDTPEVSTDGGT